MEKTLFSLDPDLAVKAYMNKLFRHRSKLRAMLLCLHFIQPSCNFFERFLHGWVQSHRQTVHAESVRSYRCLCSRAKKMHRYRIAPVQLLYAGRAEIYDDCVILLYFWAFVNQMCMYNYSLLIAIHTIFLSSVMYTD